MTWNPPDLAGGVLFFCNWAKGQHLEPSTALEWQYTVNGNDEVSAISVEGTE